MSLNLDDLQIKKNMISLKLIDVKNLNPIETKARNNERLIFIFAFLSVVNTLYMCTRRTIGRFCNNIDLVKGRALWTAN